MQAFGYDIGHVQENTRRGADHYLIEDNLTEFGMSIHYDRGYVNIVREKNSHIELKLDIVLAQPRDRLLVVQAPETMQSNYVGERNLYVIDYGEKRLKIGRVLYD